MTAKTVAKILGGLLTLIIVALLVAPMFISSDALKAQLVAQVKKATGRTLEIKGATSVRLFPNIAVTAEDVTLSNPDGFSSPYFVHLDKLATGAALKPLLNGELIITGITLDAPSINLEELAGGRKNWEFTADKVQDAAEDATKKPVAKAKTTSPIKRFALGDITINDGAVNVIKPKAQVMTITAINATLQGADASVPLGLDATAEYRGEQVDLSLDIAKPKEFMNGETSPFAASVKLPGGSLDFAGEGRMGDAIEASGKLAVSTASLPKVLAWATGAPANDALPKQVSVKGDMVYAPNRITLNDAALRADSLTADGHVEVALGGTKPEIRGALKTGMLDIDDFTGPARASKPSASTAASAGSPAPSEGWSSTPIDLSGLNAVNTDLGITLEGLKTGKLELGKTVANVAINGGKLRLTISQAQLYSGMLSGVVNAGGQGIGADVKLAGVAIEPLLVALTEKSRLEGKADLALNITAKGNNMRSWIDSLNGNGNMVVRDGAIKGINIGQFLRQAKKGFLFDSERESTDFSELSASFTINQGVLNNKDLAMKSPALRVAGSGSANLSAKTVNYRLVPTLAGTSKGQGGKDEVGGITLPLVITGPWSNPSVTPDLAGMIQEGLNDPEKLKANVKNIKETIGDFNSPKDIKRALLGEKTTTPPTTTPATTTETPAPATKKEQREEMIQQGIGSLLKGL